MKDNLTKRRIKAPKKRACGMCKPWKQGWQGKRTINEQRRAVDASQQLKEAP